MTEPTDHRIANNPNSPADPAPGSAWALGSARFPELANPVVFHLLRLPSMTGRMLWLYTVYEQGGAEFDSAAQIDPGGNEGRMAELLGLFMVSDECISAVVEPLAARVAAHLRR